VTTLNQLHIAPEVWSRFPDIKTGVAVIQDVTVKPQHPELEAQKDRIYPKTIANFKGVPLSAIPRICRFRQIYHEFGVDPGKRHPSAEALMMRVLRNRGIYTINTVVDSYNLTSVEFQLPMAAYDLDILMPPVELRFARQGEMHLSIGDHLPDMLCVGELVYADQARIMCRDFNYRDSELTKVTYRTQNLMVVVDGCEGVEATELLEALETACCRIIKFSGGTVRDSRLYMP
jgi:DNA/RNA-binding domain of Phe-tRNA-synthetase-like protein